MRPQWLPEKYKTAEEFRTGYDNLNSAFGKKNEDLKKELETEFFKERPESADKYELPTFDEKTPVDPDALAAHPMVAWWREEAFKSGMSQERFQAGIKQQVALLQADMPDEEEEKKKLGENGPAMIEAISLWAGQTFSQEEWPAINKMASTAAGIKALDRIMKNMKQVTPPPDGDPVRGRPDDENEILALMNTPAYWSAAKRDPAVVARVDRYFKTKYAAT